MLLSAVPLVHRHMSLTGRFLTAYFNPPWELLSGGKSRKFPISGLPKLMAWCSQQQELQRNVLVPLPNTGGHVWHIALRAPFEVRPAEFRLPPSLEVIADGYWLLWRSLEPLSPAKAKLIAERLAKEIGGGAREAMNEPFPLPGSIYFKTVGTRLEGRFPTQMMMPRLTAYALRGDVLTDTRATAAPSPFLRADLIQDEAMEWIWPDILAAGEFTVIMGPPGAGKSQISIDIAARVTSGAAFPGCKEIRKQASAIVLETEDDVAKVTKKRLIAAGTDMRRVMVHGQAIDLSQSVEVLENEAKRLGDLRLVVLSPVRMFFGENESSRQVDTRARLDALLRWAKARKVAILGIAHTAEGKKGQSGEDMAGPKAFAQRARAVHSAVIDTDDPEPEIKKKRRLLITAKANNSPDTLRLAYRIKASGESSRIVWE